VVLAGRNDKVRRRNVAQPKLSSSLRTFGFKLGGHFLGDRGEWNALNICTLLRGVWESLHEKI